MKNTRLYPKPGQIDQIKDEKTQVAITWNPDDEKYYVEGSETIAVYKDWRNATQRWRKLVKEWSE